MYKRQQLALAEFLKTGMSMVYLLNKRYMPYYKWSHRGLRELPKLSETAPLFAELASNAAAERKEAVVEEICAKVLDVYKRQR